MLERNNKSGVNRINSYREKDNRAIKCESKYGAYDKEAEIKKKAQSIDARIEFDDERYKSLTSAFMNTIHAKRIDIDSSDFDEKMEEILQTIYQSKTFNIRYPNDDKERVKNAILRAVNKEKDRLKKSEKGRVDE